MKQLTEVVSYEQQFVRHTMAARIHRVHPRTIDRWVDAGILPEPRVINRFKYHSLNALAAAGTRRG